MRAVVLLALLASATAVPVLSNSFNNFVYEKNGYIYSVDFTVLASQSSMSCFNTAGYASIFVSGYNASGFDSTSITNVRNAFYAGMYSEVYMAPQPKSSKTGAQQLDELYYGLVESSINVHSTWIQVVNPALNWNTNQQTNMAFIQSIISQAEASILRGLGIGIYTSLSEWNQITGGSTNLNGNGLWYWSTSGPGESADNFDDFVPFGPWTEPLIKEFSSYEAQCGVQPLKRNTFKAPFDVKASSSVQLNAAGPTVGFIQH